MKHNFIVILAAINFFFIISCDRRQTNEIKNTPNILIIFADDQRADALGIAQNPYIKTPNIDDIAKNGVLFENCYVMGGHHGAICAPSRAMLLSGKSLFHVYDRLEEVETLPNYLSKNGFQTFATGKWHNGAESFETNFQEGAKVMLGGMSDHFNVPLRDLDEYNKLNNRHNEGFSTDIFAEATLDYFDRYQASKKEKPFFCYLAFTAFFP